MNISLTTNCNNHCPYCFQQNIHNLNMEISIENYEKILKWGQDYDKEYIQLLGGEPTLYLKLPDIFEITNNYKKKISIITNLLGYKDNIELITHCNNIGSILVFFFFASQLIALFKKTNIGDVFTIKIIDILEKIEFTGFPLMIAFFILVAFVNIFQTSAVLKWSVLAPSIVPLFMRQYFTRICTSNIQSCRFNN